MFTYKINAEEVFDNLLGFEDVISVIHFTKMLSDEQNTVVFNHVVAIPAPNSKKDYINYKDISMEDRISFIEKTLGDEAIAQIDHTLTQMLEEVSNAKPRLVTFE